MKMILLAKYFVTKKLTTGTNYAIKKLIKSFEDRQISNLGKNPISLHYVLTNSFCAITAIYSLLYDVGDFPQGCDKLFELIGLA